MWLESASWLQRKCRLKMLTDGRRMRGYTLSSPMSLRLRWAETDKYNTIEEQTNNKLENNNNNEPQQKQCLETEAINGFLAELWINSRNYTIRDVGYDPSSLFLHGDSNLIWAAAWQNRKMTCAPSEDRSAWASAHSDQSLRCPHEETLGSLSEQRRLIRLYGCPGWSESLLGAQFILLVLSCWWSFLCFLYFIYTLIFTCILYPKRSLNSFHHS